MLIKHPVSDCAMSEESDYEQVTGETCPVCHEKQLTLTEARKEVPYFGVCYLFSMDCSACSYHKADVESEEQHEPAKYTYVLKDEEGLKVRVVKSSNATVKIGMIGSIEPGETANGYITNIEGVLNRLKNQVDHLKNAAQDEGDAATAKKAKNHLKKLQRALWGQDELKIVLSDPTGNSAIISPDVEKKKL